MKTPATTMACRNGFDRPPARTLTGLRPSSQPWSRLCSAREALLRAQNGELSPSRRTCASFRWAPEAARRVLEPPAGSAGSSSFFHVAR